MPSLLLKLPEKIHGDFAYLRTSGGYAHHVLNRAVGLATALATGKKTGIIDSRPFILSKMTQINWALLDSNQ